MAVTAYCKKCARDVPVGETCPHCGGKLGKSTVRVAWCAEHTPVRDWMCWNAAMRILIPVMALVLLLILLMEGIAGGGAAVERLLRGGLLFSLLALLVFLSALLLLVFMLQGDDLLDCVVDGRGIHIQQYLPEPTPLKLMLRLRSPRLMEQFNPADGFLLIGQRELSWKDIARVQLWPEKTMILFYFPTWWMRLALPCTAFTYEDSMDFIRDKLGRKKGVILPQELTAPPKPKAAKGQQEKQLSFADVPVQEVPPASPAQEQPEDFVPLADVLAEIKQQEENDAHHAGEDAPR